MKGRLGDLWLNYRYTYRFLILYCGWLYNGCVLNSSMSKLTSCLDAITARLMSAADPTASVECASIRSLYFSNTGKAALFER